MSITSEELIRRVRAAKTPAQELAIIETELSAIRSSFKLRDQPYIARNVAKLVYASMRGLNVVWGDIGVVNLCQSAKSHKEKRLAYLALQITSHDNPQYLKMASNSIKTDMESGSQYRASVALCALATAGTPEMLSELSASTLQLIRNKDSIYIRKKALAVAIRTVKTSPEVAAPFIEPCIAGILDKSHTVPLGAVQLAIQIIQSADDSVEKFVPQIPQFVKLLQELQLNPAGNDHEMGGVNDPVLQTALLKLLSLISQKTSAINETARKQLADLLENVVSTQHKKGESVLARVSVQFEAARAILQLPQQLFSGVEKRLQDLRAAAADALTEALDHKNQTVRYSALASITEIIHKTNETQGAQRHRQTVLSCMQEESITLRRRALNLLVLITDAESAQQVVQQLLDLIGKNEKNRYYLIRGALNEDIKREIISSAAFIAESFATDVQWHFDVLFACLQLYGNGKPNDDLVDKITAHLAREKSIQQYACQKLGELFVECREAPQWLYNETLIAACLYCIGECAGLIQDCTGIINCLYLIVDGPMYSQVLVRYAVSTVAKMFTKCPAAQQPCSEFLSRLLQDADPEIQQRAFEYSVAVNEPKAAGLLGAIPPPPRQQIKIVQNEYERPKPQQIQQAIPVQQVLPQPAQQALPAPTAQMLPGLAAKPLPGQIQARPIGQFSAVVPGQAKGPSATAKPMQMAVQQKPQQPAFQPQPQSNTADDLLDMGTPQQNAPQQSGPNLMDDLLGGPVTQPVQQIQQQPVQQQQVSYQPVAGQPKQLYMDNLVSFVMKPQGTPNQAECHFMISGIGTEDVKVRAQYAAQQGVQLNISPASSDVVGPNKPPVQQVVRVSGSNLALKIKLQYIMQSGGQKEQLITVANLFQ